MRKIAILLIASAIIIVGILSGCTEPGKESNDETNEEQNPHEGQEYKEMDIQLGDSGVHVITENGVNYIEGYTNVKNNEDVPTPTKFWAEFHVRSLHWDYSFKAEKYLMPHEWENLTARTEWLYDEELFLESVSYDRPHIWVDK